MVDGVDALLSEFSRVVDGAAAAHRLGQDFADIGDRLAEVGPPRSVSATSRAVVDRWLPVAVAEAPPPWAELARLLMSASSALPWLRPYEHLPSSPALEEYRDHYAYQLLCGPRLRGWDPSFHADDLLAGFTLQAPNVHYPSHHHEPPEIYGVISGEVEWQVGSEWSRRRPGDVVVHRSHQAHAMRTGSSPVLTWVAWPRNPHASVYLPTFDPPGESMAPIDY